MNKKHKLLLICALGFVPMCSFAQIMLPADSMKTIPFKNEFKEVQNKDFFILGTDSTNTLYNINGQEAAAYKPLKWTIAPMLNRKVLYYDGKNIRLNALSDNAYDNTYIYAPVYLKLKKNKFLDTVETLVYSPDGTFFLIGTGKGKLMKCSTLEKDKSARLKYTMDLIGKPTKILINNRANTAVSAEGKILNVINLDRGERRGSVRFYSEILDVAYSNDCMECAVILKDGTLHTVTIATMKEKKQFFISKTSQRCCYMKQGKYIMVADNEGVNIVNVLTGKSDYKLKSDNSSLMGMDVTEDSDNAEWLIYFSKDNFRGLPLSLIERYHKMDLKRELDVRMAEWSKIRPGESEVDYRARVNDETRAKYALELERTLVTEMAGNIIGGQEAKFGNYIESNQALSIDFDGMPSIYLNIPSEDLVELATIEDLEFFNTIYGLTDEDKFEVIYTEARNKKTGKVYIYDNLERKSIAFDAESFVPMEVIQLASIESAKLEELKQEEMKKAINEKILSDHTQISVSTEVEQDIDADGNKILNYNVNYEYNVEEEFSARDDFQAGRYNASESNAALQMIGIIKKSLEGDFAKYTDNSNKLIVSITGSADAIPILGKLKYNDEYGDINDLLVYQDGKLSTMTVTKSTGMTSNEQLAMVRAYGMSDYLKKNVLNSVTIPVEEKYNIEVAEQEGGKFRRIKVSLKFVDTFKK